MDFLCRLGPHGGMVKNNGLNILKSIACGIELFISLPLVQTYQKWTITKCIIQESQYRTRGYIDLTNGMIYFGYRSILMYHFEFIAIHIKSYIYIYIC